MTKNNIIQSTESTEKEQYYCNQCFCPPQNCPLDNMYGSTDYGARPYEDAIMDIGMCTCLGWKPEEVRTKGSICYVTDFD